MRSSAISVVLVNGDSVKSCTLLAVQAEGATVTTIEGLARRLIVEGEDHGALGRVQVEPDDIDQLRLEVGTVGELEGLHPPGLETVIPPDLRDRVLADTDPLRQRSRAPLRRIRRPLAR